MRRVKVVRTVQESLRRKGTRMKTAWRLVDEHGQDVVQPWFDTKAEALAYAKGAGHELEKLK